MVSGGKTYTYNQCAKIDVLVIQNFQPGSVPVQYEVKIGQKRKGILPFHSMLPYQNENQYVVYLKNGKKQNVKLGSRQQNKIEILEGITIGQTVFWDGRIMILRFL